jgi:hypothetical protein
MKIAELRALIWVGRLRQCGVRRYPVQGTLASVNLCVLREKFKQRFVFVTDKSSVVLRGGQRGFEDSPGLLDSGSAKRRQLTEFFAASLAEVP